MTRTIGITLGDPCGIGPELVVRTLSKHLAADTKIVLYGSLNLLDMVAKQLDIPPTWRSPSITVVQAGPDPKGGIFDPKDTATRARAVIESLDRAAEDGLAGKLTVLLTAPIDKHVVRSQIPGFSGHTGYLAQRAKVPRAVMLMDNREIRVAFVTEHISLRDVPGEFTAEKLKETVRITADGFTRYLGLRKPHIVVAGLNPHMGETVEGSEEETLIKPTIKELKAEGIEIEGPMAPDSLYALARHETWDVIISPYHDQGMVAVKYAGMEHVVNITLGLPYLRLSPGHGVAYEHVGKGTADTRSFGRSFRIALTGRLAA